MAEIELGELAAASRPKSATIEMVVTRGATGERFKRTITTHFDADGLPVSTTEVDEPLAPIDP